MKHKIVAALLALFLGEWGFHWFYLNRVDKGKKYLIWWLVGICTCWLWVGFIPLVVLWVLKIVDCFTIMFQSDEDFNERYNEQGSSFVSINDIYGEYLSKKHLTD